jgi:hypothetical protein
VPAGAVTVIGPFVAPEGTVVVICVAVAVKLVADVVLNLTDVAPVKPMPVMVTGVPAEPFTGVNDVIAVFATCSVIEPCAAGPPSLQPSTAIR